MEPSQIFTKSAIDSFFIQYNTEGRIILNAMHDFFNTVFYGLLITAAMLSLLYIAMSIYVSRPKQQKHQPINELPSVTVHIPTYNETVALRCAEKCLEFDYPEDKYEVLIGDDSSDKSVSMEIERFAEAHPKLKVHRRGSNQGYKAGNLNNLLKHSKGDIIVIFDSDFSPSKDFLKGIVQPFMHDEKIAGVQSKWSFTNADQNLISVLGSTIVEVFQRITMPFVHRRRKIAFLCGSAEAVRKKTLTELGGWDNGNLTEDIEYSLRLIKNGYRIEYLESLECESEVPYLPKDLYKQQMRWAYGVVSSYKKHAKAIFTSKSIGTEDKIYTTLICSGYLMTTLLAGLFLTGFLSVITHEPAKIDIARFAMETARNIALTSGLILASAVAIMKSKKSGNMLRMVTASFSYGLIVAYHVNIGIFKALTNKPVKWHMLSKIGNLKKTGHTS
ncbi:glycosyltransferase family 2 protein [Candidatus Woesearchaeota archaeon]|nr:glycosyltransferase family 2 protein [Candidatus Woesearchaeota archaeon]